MLLPAWARHTGRWFSTVRTLVLWLQLGIVPGELVADTRVLGRAQEFPERRQWLHTATPFRLADVRGKIVRLDFGTFGDNAMITVPEQQIMAGVDGQMLIDLQFPQGYHLNPRAPLHYRVQVAGEGFSLATQDHTQQLIAPALPLAIPFQTASGRSAATVDIAMTFYYCREDDTGVCAIESVRWQVVLHISPEGDTTTLRISYAAEVPGVPQQL